MKLINRLLIEAKAMRAGEKEIAYALVDRDGGQWSAKAYFVDLVGNMSFDVSTHATIDDAINHLHAVGEQYPARCDVPIIIDDVG